MAAVLPVSGLAQEKGIPSGLASDPALYAHAVSGSDDTEAWQKWQSAHDESFEEEKPEEKYFFLPSSVGESPVDVYNGFDGEVTVNGVKIGPHTTQSVPYETDTPYSVSVGTKNYTLTLMRSNAEAAIYINSSDEDGSSFDLMGYLNEDKNRKAAAKGAIVTPDGRIDHTGIKKIKGRGNTSWGKPKKSYNITFEKKVSIAGMEKIKSTRSSRTTRTILYPATESV